MATFKVKSSAVFRQGNGAKGPWTIYKLTLEGDPQEPTGFDEVHAGDEVELTTTSTEKNGKTYQNLNYKKVEGAASAAPAASQGGATPAATGTSDARVLKLLVIVAEQIGVDKDVILDVLQG